MEVVAVTVTYNSIDFLKRCIDSLENQSHKIKKIIVVDNNSKADIKAEERRYLSNFDNVSLFELEENTGGAGGFEFGMKKAMELNPDWVWIMDDDAHPTEDCLKNLLVHSNEPEIGCICPMIFGDELQQYQFFHHKKISNTFKESPVFKDYDSFPDICEIDANAFVGPLISAKVIKEIGVATGGLFIYGDDTEYTYRITRKYKMIVVKNAIINHRDVKYSDSSINPKIWWKEYYMFRNRLLFNKKYAKSFFQKLIVDLRVKKEIFVKIWSTRLKPKFKGYRHFRIELLKKAYSDGKKNIYGKVIDPEKYIKSLQL